jgi:tape measure domain-containing protein
MNKKIASLFASVGFDIDTTDLTKLDGHLKSIRGNTANLARNLRVTNAQLSTTSTRMRNLAKSAEAVTKFNNLGGKYVTLAVKVKDAEAAIARFGRVLKLIEPRLDSTNFRLSQTTRSYIQLARAVKAANATISQTPQRTPRPVSSSGIGGGSIGNRTSQAAQGGGFGAGFLGGLASTVGRFTPTGLVGSTALTTGAVGLNEVRKAGQDQQRMENILLFSTKSQEEYARSLQFVREEALRLGLNSVELGRAFAQVNLSAREKLSEVDRRKLFTDLSEYIAVTGAGQEDQKLIFKAINQMFSLGRIQAEELNQLTERGVPRTLIYDVAKEVYKVDSTEKVLKLQEQGKLDPSKLLPVVFDRFAKQARESGAFDKAQSSSILAQNRLAESLRQASDKLLDAGLDKAFATFFNTLNAGIPVVMTLIKGFGGVYKGISSIVKIIGTAIKGLSNFIATNSQLVLTFSVLLGIFALLTARVLGTTLAFGKFGALLATLGRRIPLIALLLTLFYLFKEYDRYVKGEDSWMSNFADWMIYLAETTRLWKEETISAFNAVKELRLGDAVNGVTEGLGKAVLDEIIPPTIRRGFESFGDKRKQLRDEVERLTYPNPFNRTSSVGSPVEVGGYVQVSVDLRQPNGKVENILVNAPVRNVSTAGLRET